MFYDIKKIDVMKENFFTNKKCSIFFTTNKKEHFAFGKKAPLVSSEKLGGGGISPLSSPVLTPLRASENCL